MPNPNTDLEHPQGDTVPATQPGGPREPTLEELPITTVAPGWQQPPKPRVVEPYRCNHLGRVVAALNLPNQEVGDEWICTCGQLFRVEINAGDKKVLRKQDGAIANVAPPEVAESQVINPPDIETPPLEIT